MSFSFNLLGNTPCMQKLQPYLVAIRFEYKAIKLTPKHINLWLKWNRIGRRKPFIQMTRIHLDHLAFTCKDMIAHKVEIGIQNRPKITITVNSMNVGKNSQHGNPCVVLWSVNNFFQVKYSISGQINLET